MMADYIKEYFQHFGVTPEVLEVTLHPLPIEMTTIRQRQEIFLSNTSDTFSRKYPVMCKSANNI